MCDQRRDAFGRAAAPAETSSRLDHGVHIPQRREKMTGASQIFQCAARVEVVAYQLQHRTHFLDALARRVYRIVRRIANQVLGGRAQLFPHDTAEAPGD
jgi:hypothetical protein